MISLCWSELEDEKIGFKVFVLPLSLHMERLELIAGCLQYTKTLKQLLKQKNRIISELRSCF